jgi:hypothetical protein
MAILSGNVNTVEEGVCTGLEAGLDGQIVKKRDPSRQRLAVDWFEIAAK